MTPERRGTLPWALIQHIPWEGPGSIASEARAHGVHLDTRRMFAGDRVPSVREISGLVVMGGPMGALDDAQHPNLPAERALLGEAVRAGLPVLGVCLGSQLLAASLGARVYRGPEAEVGLGQVELTPDGLRDPVLSAAVGSPADGRVPVCHWHGDTFDLPPDAVHLARSTLYPNQAFRVGELAYGFQFHLELDRPLFESWAPRFPSGAPMSAALQPAIEDAGRRVFRRFFAPTATTA